MGRKIVFFPVSDQRRNEMQEIIHKINRALEELGSSARVRENPAQKGIACLQMTIASRKGKTETTWNWRNSDTSTPPPPGWTTTTQAKEIAEVAANMSIGLTTSLVFTFYNYQEVVHLEMI